MSKRILSFRTTFLSSPLSLAVACPPGPNKSSHFRTKLISLQWIYLILIKCCAFSNIFSSCYNECCLRATAERGWLITWMPPGAETCLSLTFACPSGQDGPFRKRHTVDGSRGPPRMPPPRSCPPRAPTFGRTRPTTATIFHRSNIYSVSPPRVSKFRQTRPSTNVAQLIIYIYIYVWKSTRTVVCSFSPRCDNSRRRRIHILPVHQPFCQTGPTTMLRK